MKLASNLLAIALALTVAWNSAAQQTSPQNDAQLRREQQQQEAARAAAEAKRREEEAARKQYLDSITVNPVDLAKTTPRQASEPCLAQSMDRSKEFDLAAEIPIAKWLAGGDTTQIPWKVQIRKAELRIDQRYEIAYSGTIDGKHLGWAGEGEEFLYASGVSTLD